jgi:NitT/TauT family transport system substrate-binding protein
MTRLERGMSRRRSAMRACVLAVAVALGECGDSVGAEQAIKIGIVKFAASCPVYLAIEKGYFAHQGLGAELTSFEAAQPVAVATVSGDIDFGVSGLTAGFYNLAADHCRTGPGSSRL